MSRRPLVAVSAFHPWPITNGYVLRVAHLVECLAREWDMVLIAPPAPARSEWPAEGALRDWVRLEVPRRGVALGASAAGLDAVRDAYADAVGRHAPDAALLWAGTESLATEAESPPALCDRIDAMTLHEWRRIREARGLRARGAALRSVAFWARAERRALLGSGAMTVVGEADARVLRGLAPGAADRVHVVPNGVRLAADPDGAGEHDRPTVIFTGVMHYGPNITAATHFVEEVWPRVRADRPDARFVIAGRNPRPEVRALAGREGVEVMADVPDIPEILRTGWVAVAPMLSGSGLKNKVLEAWAVGRPVVMYPLAANGLDAERVCPDLVVPGSGEMAARVLSLLGDDELRARHGRRAYRAAGERSWDVAARKVSEILRDLADRPDGGARGPGRRTRGRGR